MKLNVDCIRDVLLTVESCDYNESLRFSDLVMQLPNHEEKDLAYTCLKLKEGGFLEITTKNLGSEKHVIKINDITYDGHQFLENIRDNSTWEKLRSLCLKAGAFSIPVIQNVISTFFSDTIQNLL